MKTKIRGILLFCAGLLTAFIIQFIYPPPRDVMAVSESYVCERTGMPASKWTGKIGDQRFFITYEFPSCYEENNYHVKQAYWGDYNMIWVEYEKDD